MKKSISTLLAVMLAVIAAVTLGGCGDKGDMDDYIDNMYADGFTASVSDGDISQYVAPGSDILPDGVIGTWVPKEIYQFAVASDISDEQAMQYEQQYGLTLGYSTFYRYGDDISGAVFKVNTDASFDDMLAQGIQIDPLAERYGEQAKITAIGVYDSTGSYCTTLFFAGGDTVISYGAGMYVFEYELMESVG